METESSSVVGSSRIGLRLFAVYTLFYAGFVLVNAFAPQWSEWTPWGGINLAVLWGFALIGLAFVLALIYGFVRSGEDRTDLAESRRGEENEAGDSGAGSPTNGQGEVQ